jgi:hypothetical protein
MPLSPFLDCCLRGGINCLIIFGVTAIIEGNCAL